MLSRCSLLFHARCSLVKHRVGRHSMSIVYQKHQDPAKQLNSTTDTLDTVQKTINTIYHKPRGVNTNFIPVSPHTNPLPSSLQINCNNQQIQSTKSLLTQQQLPTSTHISPQQAIQFNHVTHQYTQQLGMVLRHGRQLQVKSHQLLQQYLPSQYYTLPTTFGAALASPLLRIPLATFASSSSSSSRRSKGDKQSKNNVREAEIVDNDAPDWGYSRETQDLARANDGVWAPRREQNRHRSVARAHLHAEAAADAKDYNDYMREVLNTRDQIVDQRKERWLNQESDQSESDDDDGFVDFNLLKRREKELQNVTTKEQEEQIMEKYDERVHERVNMRLYMFIAAWFVFMSVTYDTIDPDTYL